ncbi:MAG TPA: glycosyltransferase [Candidatus Acidoferrum sp.]|nr:glycosyltransferase [Candidatus Acidoferrum sp.]
MPAVTVLIPAYNAERCIGRAVEDALGQTLRDLEVIVVDDGSRDATAEAARAAARGDTRLRIIRLGENQGVAAARNTGLARARGSWIALLDADDRIERDRLERLTREAVASEADLLADNLLVHNVDAGEPPSLAFPPERMEARGPIDAVSFVDSDRPAWGTRAAGFIKPLMRRSFLEEHGLGYTPGIHAGSDFHLYVRCLLHGARLFYIPNAAYRYAISHRSLCRADTERIQQAFKESSGRLRAEAIALGRPDVAARLLARERHIDAWVAYERFVFLAREGRAGPMLGSFLRLPSRWYALGRLALGLQRRIRERMRRSRPHRATAR